MATSGSDQRRRGRPPKGTRGDTRQELLDAALRLFARQGYAATTVRQIADEVGVRDSAIYAHFNAKRELLDELIEESSGSLVDAIGLDPTRMSDKPPEDVLPEFFERLVMAWDGWRPRQLISMLTREGVEQTQDMIRSLQARFTPHIERWVREGRLRDDVPTTLLLWELTTPLVAIRILYLNGQASPARRKAGRRLARDHVNYFLETAAET